jgi:hypothetical protein
MTEHLHHPSKKDIGRWNWQTRTYDSVEISDDWYVSIYETDLSTSVNCASCGIKLPMGDCYASQEFQTKMGMGYGVCEQCNLKEWQREKESKESK